MNYFILFHDNSVREINENQYSQFIESAFNNEVGIQLGDSFIKHSSYKQILSEEDYYKQYPDRRPVVYEDKFKKYETLEQQITLRANWIKGIILGIRKYIDEKGGLENASRNLLDLLDKWERKLKKYENN